MKKSLILFFVVLTAVSCMSHEDSTVYPDDIVIEGYGTLHYQSTLLAGYDIDDFDMKGDEFWAISESLDSGGIFHHYNKATKNHSTHIFKGSISSSLNLIDENYIVGLHYCTLAPDSEIYEEYHIGIINRNTDVVVEKDVPLQDGFYLTIVDGEIYLKYNYYEVDDRYFTSSDLGETWTELYTYPIEGYYSSSMPYTDAEGRIYDFTRSDAGRIQDDALTVSVDDEASWTTGALGTNFTRKLLVDGDTVYIGCARSCTYLLFIGLFDDGGGIHIMEWDLESENSATE